MRNDSESGNNLVTFKWVVGIFLLIIVGLINLWAAQRLGFENNISERVVSLEKIQTRLLERSDANAETLDKIYDELRQHRVTGK